MTACDWVVGCQMMRMQFVGSAPGVGEYALFMWGAVLPMIKVVIGLAGINASSSDEHLGVGLTVGARCKMVNWLFTLGFPVQTNTDGSFLVVLR